MPTPLQKIKDLLPSLPECDLKYAKSFLEKRDFENLRELVWSSLTLAERNLEKEVPNPKYSNLNVDKIRELACVCEDYYHLLYPEDYDDNEDEDLI